MKLKPPIRKRKRQRNKKDGRVKQIGLSFDKEMSRPLATQPHGGSGTCELENTVEKVQFILNIQTGRSYVKTSTDSKFSQQKSLDFEKRIELPEVRVPQAPSPRQRYASLVEGGPSYPIRIDVEVEPDNDASGPTDAKRRKAKKPVKLVPFKPDGTDNALVVAVPPQAPRYGPKVDFHSVITLVSNPKETERASDEVAVIPDEVIKEVFLDCEKKQGPKQIPMEHSFGQLPRVPVGEGLFRLVPRQENVGFYQQPMLNSERAEAAIRLSSVKYTYPHGRICGPKIAKCENRPKDLMLGTGAFHEVYPRRPMDVFGMPWLDRPLPSWGLLRPLHDYTQPLAEASAREPSAAQAIEAPVPTTKRVAIVTPAEPTFSALIFIGKPGEDGRVVAVNSEQAFQWTNHLMVDKDSFGRSYLRPERLLSIREMSMGNKIISTRSTHYLMVHDPRGTHKNGTEATHDPRVWTENQTAKAQVFLCSGRLNNEFVYTYD